MTDSTLVVGRYALHRRIASGGMASVHIGRLQGIAGFSRAVAIKRLHEQFATDPDFVEALLDEARLVSRIRHPNVVPVLDVVAQGKEVLLVMEYIHGLAVSALLRASRSATVRPPVPVAMAIIADTLRGLHAAHEASAEDGTPLGLVHRDVSPQNILVTAEGVALIADFGIAKAAGRAHTTKEGQIKGKLAYMAPEQLMDGNLSRRTDVYAAAVVLWELLANEPLFGGDSEAVVYTRIIQHRIPPLRDRVPHVPRALEAAIVRGLAIEPEERFASALEMATVLEDIGAASRTETAAWIDEVAGETLNERAAWLAEMDKKTVTAPEVKALHSDPPPRAPAPPMRPARRIVPALVMGALGGAAAVAVGWAALTPPEPTATPSTSAPAATAPATSSAVAPAPTPTTSAAPAPTTPPSAPRTFRPPIPPRPPKPPATKACRKLGADGIWRIEQCPVE